MTVAEYRDAARSPQTHRCYQSLWKGWEKWCAELRIDPLPPDVDMFLRYITQRMAAGDSTRTARMRVTAIRDRCRLEQVPDTLGSPTVAEFMKGVLRTHGTFQKQATGLTAARFAKLRAANASDKRLIAIVAVMRDAMLRRSEAAALRWSDIEFKDDGTGRLAVRRSKSDQTGKGAVQYLSSSTVEALREMGVGEGSDPVFGICDRTLSDMIKAGAAKAGLKGSYSGHSPRVGMAQDLAEGGATLPEMMHAGRWRSPGVAAAYVRGQEAGRNAVASYYGREANA